MKYKIVIEQYAEQKIVHTYISGDLSEEARNRISVETIKTLNDNQLHKTIWDMREAKLMYSLTKIHMAVVNAKAAGLKDENYIALIYKNNEREYQHAKIVTKSLGIENLDYFQDLDEGINWLIGRG